jgi:outer membrane protein TolC
MPPVFLVFLSLPALAAQPLSLAEALAQALGGSPELRAAELAVEAAAASETDASAAFSPTLSARTELGSAATANFIGGFPTTSTTQDWSGEASLGGSLATGTDWSVDTTLRNQSFSTTTELGGVPTEVDQSTWTSSATLSLQQDLLVLLRPTAARSALRQAVEARDIATTEALAQRQDTLATVAGLWWDWTEASAALVVAERSLEAARALEAVTVAWVEEGSAEAVEGARVRAERLQQELAARTARAEVEDARDALLVGIGLAPGADVVAAGPTGARTLSVGSLDEHRARMNESRADLRALEAELEAAGGLVSDARWDRLPSLSAVGSAGVASLESAPSDAVAALATSDRLPSWSAGLELSVPLGGRAARAKQASAGVAVRQARLSLEAARREADAELQAALRGVELATASLDLARERVEVARLTEDGEQARVDAGSRRLDELVEAAQDREDAELAALEAEVTLWRAHLRLAQVEGRVEAVLTPASASL